MPVLLILAIQAATAAAPAPDPKASQPEKFSILVPVGNEPCVKRPGDDIVVCGEPLPSQKLPYPDEVVPDGPVPSNPQLRGTGALAAQATPCPISRNCVVGFGPPIVPIIKGAVDLAKKAFAKKPDKTGRVPIDMSDPTPSAEGKILP